ncbi:uncharacterized protein MONOS_2889 [Monocercomonoides exilis]|uniref:uncharacterized protein n=1 Tax=Monocercomonoides exilis TaxID=2049356 RepID=UPI003559FE66|nr:hypothetical protein MONOS_2889 [Monocercomonoides exilis]|eukprot:MONOS_2889.1-p1 / transcript=MONOS_2889.1 / gene=MONOS_2889 / organism=Monocercomonoides_exilis_PA203 / gene_product=unspecified product / transcript_product=unspecified product / location=Mono_scaffold00063:5781-8447(-) / protein_length=888 / sequence_SO=supercontig / SO=protein_coding / is_pseudo=false
MIPHIDRLKNEGKGDTKIEFTIEDLSQIMDEFSKRCAECELFENLVFFFGRSQVGKSTLINRLRGMVMEEDDKGDLVARTSLEKAASMGKGVCSETKIPKAYKLNGKLSLLDTRGFYGKELNVIEDVVSSLILQFYQRYAKKVMVVYLTEFANYQNLTNAHNDMGVLNKKCRNKNMPVLFLANKCKEKRIIIMKDRLQAKKESGSYDGRADAEEIIKEAQDLLNENIEKLKNATIEKIADRFSEVSTSMTPKQIMETLLDKAQNATGTELEEARIGLNEMQIIYLWDKAIAEGRMLHYDPTLACSVEQLTQKIEDSNNYRDPCDVNLEFFSKYYDRFIDSITTMANKFYWLALAMRGRQRIPNYLKDVVDACKVLTNENSKLYSDVSTQVQQIDEALGKMNFQPINMLMSIVKNERNAAKRCDEEIQRCQKNINKLDKDERVKYETVKFDVHENYSSNEYIIHKPINVPNTTVKFTSGNKHTRAEKLCIEGGKLQGTFRAPNTFRHLGNIVYVMAGLGVPMMFANETSECKGKIELYAPMRDIPSNSQKILEFQLMKNQIEKEKKEIEKKADSHYDELCCKLRGNKKMDDEKHKKEKEKGKKEKMCEELKNMEEIWISRSSKLNKCFEFCEECENEWNENLDLMMKLYNFARIFVPEKYINEVEKETGEDTSRSIPPFYSSSSSSFCYVADDSASASASSPSSPTPSSPSPSSPSPSPSSLPPPPPPPPPKPFLHHHHPTVPPLRLPPPLLLPPCLPPNPSHSTSSSTSPSSSVTPCTQCSFESRQFEELSQRSLSERKVEKKQFDLSYLLQPNEDFRIIARFVDAMNRIGLAPKYKGKINLMTNEKYDLDRVSDAVEGILHIWNEVFECKGYLQEFTELSLNPEKEE